MPICSEWKIVFFVLLDEMIQHGGDLYRSLDKNDDGVVTVAEIVNALKVKQSHAKGQQVELYKFLIEHVKDIDKNHDNKISFVGKVSDKQVQYSSG